jgi:HSP20 family protein
MTIHPFLWRLIMTLSRTCSVPASRMGMFPFASFLGDVESIQGELNRALKAPSATSLTASVWTDNDAFYAEIDIPGIDPATLDITLDDGTEVIIKGERKYAEPENVSWLRKDRPAATFARTLSLPEPINADAVEARCEHGVLKLTLPKSESAKPKKIAVKL